MNVQPEAYPAWPDIVTMAREQVLERGEAPTEARARMFVERGCDAVPRVAPAGIELSCRLRRTVWYRPYPYQMSFRACACGASADAGGERSGCFWRAQRMPLTATRPTVLVVDKVIVHRDADNVGPLTSGRQERDVPTVLLGLL